ncbi:MAG: hypothetical protein ACYTF6_08860, partial [Planctomycetota bacterium]
MTKLHRLSLVALMTCLVAASTPTVLGQEADADQAKALLQRGIQEFKALEFEAARTTLLNVNKEGLSEAEAETLDGYLRKVDTAVLRQRQAREAMRAAEKALRENDFEAAIRGFEAASKSEYITQAERGDAEAKLALAREKAKAAAAAEAAEVPEAEEVEVEPVAPAKPEPEVPAEPEAPPAVEPEPAAEKPPTAPPTEPVPEPAEEDVIARLQAERDKKAKQCLEMGKKALAANQFAKAVDYLGRALKLDPDNVEAKHLYETARKRLAVTGEPSILSSFEETIQVGHQIAQLELDKKMKQSRELLEAAESAEQFDEVIKLAGLARLTLENNESFFEADDYRDQMLRIDQYLKWAAMRKEKWQRAEAVRLQREAEKKRQARIARQIKERQRRIQELSRDARLLRGQQKFRQALEIVEELLALDPKQPWANEQRQILQQFVVLEESKEADLEERWQESRLSADIRRKMIPRFQEMDFPRNWEEIRQRATKYGATAAGETEEDRAVRQKLKAPVRKLDF